MSERPAAQPMRDQEDDRQSVGSRLIWLVADTTIWGVLLIPYDRDHRLWSSAASFQKGLYHLFVLRRGTDADVFARVLRNYQAAFLLVGTAYLLDFRQSIPTNGGHPDPSAALTHGMLRKWEGFPSGHPMENISKLSVENLRKTWDARNNLIYRPYMKLQGAKPARGFYEDCTLQDLLSDVPEPHEVEACYVDFIEAVGRWNGTRDEAPAEFVGLLLVNYVDQRGRFPTAMLLRRYALVLNETGGVPIVFQTYANEWVDKILSAFRQDP